MISALHDAVRQALQAGDFDNARKLGEELGAAITRELAARPELFEQRIALLRENLSLATVLRAHVASELQTNTAVCVYQPETSAGNSWGFDA